jgi:hypothetical protein
MKYIIENWLAKKVVLHYLRISIFFMGLKYFSKNVFLILGV